LHAKYGARATQKASLIQAPPVPGPPPTAAVLR
jgi:hypothetical protein